MKILSAFLHCERAATGIEYAVIAAGIALAIIAIVSSLGGNLRGILDSIAAAING